MKAAKSEILVKKINKLLEDIKEIDSISAITFMQTYEMPEHIQSDNFKSGKDIYSLKEISSCPDNDCDEHVIIKLDNEYHY